MELILGFLFYAAIIAGLVKVVAFLARFWRDLPAASREWFAPRLRVTLVASGIFLMFRGVDFLEGEVPSELSRNASRIAIQFETVVQQIKTLLTAAVVGGGIGWYIASLYLLAWALLTNERFKAPEALAKASIEFVLVYITLCIAQKFGVPRNGWSWGFAALTLLSTLLTRYLDDRQTRATVSGISQP